MNLQAQFMNAALKTLEALPMGVIATYVGNATIALRKTGDNEWTIESVDCGLNKVTNGYLASKNPLINEDPV